MEYVIWTVLVLVIVGAIAWGIFKFQAERKQQQMAFQNFEQKFNEYNTWLHSHGILRSKVLGGYSVYGYSNIEGLIIDTVNKKLCKVFDFLVFEFSEIVGVEVNKKFARESNGASNASRSGGSVGYSSSGASVRKSGGSTSRNSYRTTQDASTYTVLIKTSQLENSLIAIPCGTGHEVAEEIKATVKNIMAECKKAEKAKEE